MKSMSPCRLCGEDLTETFVDLGMSPLCESYVPRAQLDAAETFYPLHVRVCSSCLLVQLPAYVAGEDIFSDYLYFSFTNATAFSPTDTLPLSRWAKMVMMFQSAVSLVTVALVVARAVNAIS